MIHVAVVAYGHEITAALDETKSTVVIGVDDEWSIDLSWKNDTITNRSGDAPYVSIVNTTDCYVRELLTSIESVAENHDDDEAVKAWRATGFVAQGVSDADDAVVRWLSAKLREARARRDLIAASL